MHDDYIKVRYSCAWTSKQREFTVGEVSGKPGTCAFRNVDNGKFIKGTKDVKTDGSSMSGDDTWYRVIQLGNNKINLQSWKNNKFLRAKHGDDDGILKIPDGQSTACSPDCEFIAEDLSG